jgi:hypothetical protein
MRSLFRKTLTAEEAVHSINALNILPGSAKARSMGCVCSGEHEAFRDGTGYDTSDHCPMHKHLPELAE